MFDQLYPMRKHLKEGPAKGGQSKDRAKFGPSPAPPLATKMERRAMRAKLGRSGRRKTLK